MNVEDIWADFDAIVDIDQYCKIPIPERVILINKISASCVMQVVNVLNEIRKSSNKKEAIAEKYKMWRQIHEQLLNL